jgi:hypothetical protein
MVYKLSEICSGLFIPDPDPVFYLSRIQGSKRYRIRNTACCAGRYPYHVDFYVCCSVLFRLGGAVILNWTWVLEVNLWAAQAPKRTRGKIQF